MGIHYRQQVIGELLYAMVTCRPDISFPVVKLSQYSVNPAKIHYEAAKKPLMYLYTTKTHGIYFWRKELHPSLPKGPMPDMKHDHYDSNYKEPTTNSELEKLLFTQTGCPIAHTESPYWAFVSWSQEAASYIDQKFKQQLY